MNKHKIIFLIIMYSLLAIGIGTLVFWGVRNAKRLESALNGTSLYTKEDLDNSYNDGYKDALEDKDSYVKLINEYKTNLLNLTDANTQLKSQITKLENNNLDQKTKIASLMAEKEKLHDELSILLRNKTENEAKISKLETDVCNLTADIETLIQERNTNQNTINDLNKQIADMQETIDFYEDRINQLESDTQAFATFEYDGKVIDVKCVTKGSTVEIDDPESTEYLVFNGWKVDGRIVDLTTYILTTNTTFVADITYYFDVKFMVDNIVHDSQLIVKNGYATVPEIPTKDGYEFDGWKRDGKFCDTSLIEQTAVGSEMTYNAVFTKLHRVIFIYELETKAIITVRNGEYATAPSIESTDYKKLNGWTINGTDIVDLSTYKINADTIFNADITYYYDVTFMVDDSNYLKTFGEKGKTLTMSSIPTKDGYAFIGWTINGTDIVDLSTYIITANTTFTAKFEKIYVATFFDRDNQLYSRNIIEGSTLPNLNAPTREGYEFVGWSVDGKTKFDYTTPITTNMMFKALWGHTVNWIYGKDRDFDSSLNFKLYQKNSSSDLLKNNSIFSSRYNSLDYTVDLTKSSIKYEISPATEISTPDCCPELITINSSNLGVLNVCSGQRANNLITTGSLSIKVDVNGTLTLNLGDYKVKYNKNNTDFHSYIAIYVSSYSLYIVSAN